MSSNQILQFQKAFPNFGIKYQGPTDGLINPQFVKAMKELEEIIQAKSGEDVMGQIFTGSGVGMSVGEVFRKFFPQQTAPKEEALKEKEDNSFSLPVKSQTSPISSALKEFQSILKEQGLYLGMVDGLPHPEMDAAAKQLENKISAALDGKAVSIWNSVSKKMQTTPEDIRKALELLEKYQPKLSIKSSVDNRFIKMTQLWLQK
jgi:hypothetical protein